MPQPTILRTAGRAIAVLGGNPFPNGQGVMGGFNLNDGINTKITDLSIDGDTHQLELAQLLYKGRGAWMAEDWGPGHYSIPMIYYEDATHFLGDFKGRLGIMGEQQLTFDNLTSNLVRYKGVGKPKALNRTPPYSWAFSLELLAADDFWSDLAATTLAAFAVTDTGHAFNITYGGMMWAEPVWTVVIPNPHGVDLSTFKLANTMANEVLTVNFSSVAPILTASARTITIDSGAETATDNLGNTFDTYGSFPKLYGPPGTVNSFLASFAPTAGAFNTLACSHYRRWLI